MKVIVQHEKGLESYLPQYANQVESISSNYKIIDIEEKYLPWLTEIAQYVETNFSIRLCNEGRNCRTALNADQMIIASIGAKNDLEPADIYYNMTTYQVKEVDKKSLSQCSWISCYSERDETNAIDYIKCIGYLKELASRCCKPIIIYADIHISDKSYRYRSLACKIISYLLSDLNGVLITRAHKQNIDKYYRPSQKSYEFYLDYAIYLEECLVEAVKKMVPFLHNDESLAKFKDVYYNPEERDHNILYRNNVFYQSIDPDQEIYVVLDLGEFRRPEEYEALGLRHIPLIGDYGMLYAKRSTFDELGDMLRLEIAYPYYIPILSCPFYCESATVQQNFFYDIAGEDLAYKGEGVYIGVVTTDNIDYTNMALRKQDGESRIAYIWEQERVDEGKHFAREQINEALQSPNPQQIINLPERDSICTMVLAIAGGKSILPYYRGVATEAEFVVAKVNTAPEAIQRIYGGMPSQNAVLMADLLIGVLKLVEFAKRAGKPLVLCIPYNTNIDSHDGTLMLYEILGLIAARERITIIVPTGEEADKMHHYGNTGPLQDFNNIEIHVPVENQNIVGIMYQRLPNVITASLYPPGANDIGPFADLERVSVTPVDGALVYSNGYRISPLNGAARLIFRIENPKVGIWRLVFELDTQLSSPMDLWISQEELNPHIILSPATPFITIGALASINNLITVGGYNENNNIVLRSSGRGYTWDNRITPLLVTHGNAITAPCGMGKWTNVTGTLPAASIMAGAAATVYSKYIAEQLLPFPNTLVMSSILLGVIRQLDGIEYPNPNKGYGIFDVRNLNSLLLTPLLV